MEILDQELPGRRLAAGFEPEDAKRQRCVNRGLGFRSVDSQNGEGRLALAQQPAGIGRAEGFFQINSGGQASNSKAGEMTLQSAEQLLLVAGPRGFLGGRRAAVALALAADFQTSRTCLSQPLHSQTQRPILHLGNEHAANRVAFGRPQVKKTFVVLARNRVLGLAEIEGRGAILEYGRARGLAEEVLHGAREGVWSHEGIVHIGRDRVCDE